MTWIEADGGVEREFTFGSSTDAFGLMTRVAFISEDLDHHPESSNVYDRATIRLTTPDARSTVSRRDPMMAQRTDALVA